MRTIRAESEAKAKQILQWVDWADKDYISARMLLVEGLLVQGAVFSNTAIEKYLKAICLAAALPFPKTHQVPDLDGLIRSRGINLKLNADYLRIMSKAYELRYPDSLPVGYNICLSQAKLLTELDCSVFEIRKGFGFRVGSGKGVRTRFDILLEAKDKTLTDSNCAFGSAKREEVFGEKNRHYELRVLQDGNIIEAEYGTEGTKDDGIFDVVALKPGKSPDGTFPDP
jgi:HEPN domain-containing protein